MPGEVFGYASSPDPPGGISRYLQVKWKLSKKDNPLRQRQLGAGTHQFLSPLQTDGSTSQTKGLWTRYWRCLLLGEVKASVPEGGQILSQHSGKQPPADISRQTHASLRVRLEVLPLGCMFRGESHRMSQPWGQEMGWGMGWRMGWIN